MCMCACACVAHMVVLCVLCVQWHIHFPPSPSSIPNRENDVLNSLVSAFSDSPAVNFTVCMFLGGVAIPSNSPCVDKQPKSIK